MKEQKLFDAITAVSEHWIEDARTGKLKTARRWQLPLGALAACALLVVMVSLVLPRNPDIGGAVLAVVFPTAYAFDDYEAKHSAIDQNPVDEGFLSATRDFSYQTAAQLLSAQGENANYSPLSLYYALSMTAAGAQGDTAQELLQLLGVSDQATLATQCGNLYRQLYTDNAIGKLKIANSLWLDDESVWKDAFVKTSATQFYAEAHSVNFADAATGKAMGRWIAANTGGTLTPQITTTPQQILSILNTVYFKDEWVSRFDKANTKANAFYLSDGSKVQTDFMHQKFASAGFSIGEGFTRAQLSLKNSGSMVFILPDEGITPQSLLATPDKAKAAFEGGTDSHGEVVWQVPKFRFGSQFSLPETLKALGVQMAFSPNADFRAMTDGTAFISDVRQETHIAIDENGVEASAFTRIDYAGAAPPKDKAEMILNRPFLYGITAPNGTLLFVGICENPSLTN